MIGKNVYINSPVVFDGNMKNIKFGKGVTINPFCWINISDKSKIFLGNNVRISAGTKLITKGLDVSQIEKRRDHITYGDIILEDNVWIGANSVVIGNVRIGKNSVVAANSFVNKNIPSNCVYGGTPAKLIKKLS